MFNALKENTNPFFSKQHSQTKTSSSIPTPTIWAPVSKTDNQLCGSASPCFLPWSHHLMCVLNKGRKEKKNRFLYYLNYRTQEKDFYSLIYQLSIGSFKKS